MNTFSTRQLVYNRLEACARLLLWAVTCLAIVSVVHGQERFPFDSSQWTFNGEYTIEEYKGAQALVIPPGTTAQLSGVSMKDGIIEYDIAFSPARGFVYTFFRMQDDTNYEEFYFRPHQSGNPDAMQYTPVYNSFSGWQLYHGANHSTAYKYKDNEWMHIKMVIKGSRMELFIDNMNIPVLNVFELKREPVAGPLSFGSALTEARIANVTISEPERIDFVNAPEEIPTPGPEVITSWEVSSPFSRKRLENELASGMTSALTWDELPVEYSGIVNLAQKGARGEENNTILARFTVNSDNNQLKQLEFGYSDIARIYVNGKAVYEGQRLFTSRDYRYLGTIGYFDSLFLDLRRGENEVVFAVSENFGGWGVMARFVDMDKIEL